MYENLPDGLVVLKPRPPEVKPEADSQKTDNAKLQPNKNKTTLQMIQENIVESDSQQSEVRYDIVFHNKAMEKVLGFADLQNNLHTPSLLLDQ